MVLKFIIACTALKFIEITDHLHGSTKELCYITDGENVCDVI